MDYNLTKKQQEGLEICLQRYKEGKPYTVIAGYAGTGKSYLVNAIVDAFGFAEDEVAYASFTGKAALVLQNQGKAAMTLHKLLYKSYPNGYGGFVHRPKPELDEELKLIIVDEISMCPKKLWNLLMKHNRYVIALGDPFQLPPIDKDSDNGLLNKPHIFLTEVMRQALDNDIIKYSMQLREGKNLEIGIKGNNIQTLNKKDLVNGMFAWADQILCAKNDTRKWLNQSFRQLLGFTDTLNNGDKLICVKNYWSYISENEECLVNGLTGKVSNINSKMENTICATFKTGEDSFGELLLDHKLLKEGKPFVEYTKRGKVLPKKSIEMDFGYAITVHKAQGSQFNRVLVYDDCWLEGEEYRRWLYTAITRAIDKVVILL